MNHNTICLVSTMGNRPCRCIDCFGDGKRVSGSRAAAAKEGTINRIVNCAAIKVSQLGENMQALDAAERQIRLNFDKNDAASVQQLWSFLKKKKQAQMCETEGRHTLYDIGSSRKVESSQSLLLDLKEMRARLRASNPEATDRFLERADRVNESDGNHADYDREKTEVLCSPPPEVPVEEMLAYINANDDKKNIPWPSEPAPTSPRRVNQPTQFGAQTTIGVQTPSNQGGAGEHPGVTLDDVDVLPHDNMGALLVPGRPPSDMLMDC